MPVAVVFFIFLGLTAKDFVNTPMGSGINEAGGVLSFASTIWGCTSDLRIGTWYWLIRKGVLHRWSRLGVPSFRLCRAFHSLTKP